MTRIGIVAGELSGDMLGEELLAGLRQRLGDVSIEGVGGEGMQRQGCRNIFPMEKLSVMGIFEVLHNLPELLKLRRKLVRHFITNPPDVYIGIDAPDFNLPVERMLKKKGIRVVHYVSPSVWAWRSYRIKKIKQSVDLMMNLFPFENAIYEQNGVACRFVGHPLARRIPLQPDRIAARQRLGLLADETLVGIFPGSRVREIRTLLPVFLEAAAVCRDSHPGLSFVSSLPDDRTVELCNSICRHSAGSLPLSVFKDRSHDVLEACDVLLLASGTITLEAMLYKKPMVVAYQLHPLSYLLVKLLAHVEFAALPNLIAGHEIVPECMQSRCNPANLAEQLNKWLEAGKSTAELEKEFAVLHEALLEQEGFSAAELVTQILEQGTVNGQDYEST